MQAWSVGELSSLVHKHGGRPIGSLTWLPLSDFSYPAEKEPELRKTKEGYTELDIPQVLTSTAPHAIFMDCTHDNETPAQKELLKILCPMLHSWRFAHQPLVPYMATMNVILTCLML